MGIFIGNNVYKIRLSIASKGKGKSGGARIISYFKVENNIVYLLSIYSKGAIDNISNAQILKMMKEISS
ncbi:MAG: type II toxin-antitoxin system RelE/ParE family toxin [Alphaproteobacteria bacterium]|nr:type II toxin-antitoxin system RelE/ParE family toxin [Alphaproteobacteria bacterium]